MTEWGTYHFEYLDCVIDISQRERAIMIFMYDHSGQLKRNLSDPIEGCSWSPWITTEDNSQLSMSENPIVILRLYEKALVERIGNEWMNNIEYNIYMLTDLGKKIAEAIR